MRKLALAIMLALLLTAFLELPALAQGCSMCRTALEQSPEGKVIAGSLARGIVMLLVIPYAMFGAAGFIVFRAYRKKAAEKKERLGKP